MTGITRSCLGLATLLVAALAAPAVADLESDGPRHNSPGSVLIFPVFLAHDPEDTANEFINDTIISITNLNTSRRVNPNDYRDGDVSIHFIYVDGLTWDESNVDEPLTPGDTISVFARDHSDGNSQFGWLWVEARDPELPDLAIDFDYLIGSAIIITPELNLDWQYTPYAFRGLPGRDSTTKCTDGASGNGHCYTDDPANSDGYTNFDGEEYDYFPDRLFIEQFFGEGQDNGEPNFANVLYLMSTQMTDTRLAISLFDACENDFSATKTFDCWFGNKLSTFSSTAKQENLGDKCTEDDQLKKVFPYGWVKINVPDETDAVLGAFVQIVTKNNKKFIAGDALHFTGTREAKLERFNGG